MTAPDLQPVTRALISVSDKTGLVELGRGRISVRDLNGLRAYLED